MKHDFLVRPPHLNQAFESEGSAGGAWGNGITRRSFIKRAGGATVASLVAWNALTSMARAQGGQGEGNSSGSWFITCIGVPTDSPTETWSVDPTRTHCLAVSYNPFNPKVGDTVPLWKGFLMTFYMSVNAVPPNDPLLLQSLQVNQSVTGMPGNSHPVFPTPIVAATDYDRVEDHWVGPDEFVNSAMQIENGEVKSAWSQWTHGGVILHTLNPHPGNAKYSFFVHQ